ncbi:coiled-coil domain-containing protein 17 [Elysia marginata]|uniref:Coiled-coil domain-containing protein 17 n=1 Tax=Elysia marginata TaxID=1093978 RepID=A0AAV4EBL9_9GAST|nr:coiled-coil domain-containing protein 17 [Elysia marginata]
MSLYVATVPISVHQRGCIMAQRGGGGGGHDDDDSDDDGNDDAGGGDGGEDGGGDEHDIRSAAEILEIKFCDDNNNNKKINPAGFAIFYDFVLNLDPRIGAVRLIVGLHNNQAKLGEPTILPLVYTEPGTRQASGFNAPAVNAVIGARQPVPR